MLFTYPKTWLARGNSLMLGGAGGHLRLRAGPGVGWVVVRTPRRDASACSISSAWSPLAIPSMVLALGVLWTYVGLKWLPIYGTIWILLIAYVTHYPAVRRARRRPRRCASCIAELEDAARVTGAELVEDRALHRASR